jgi:type IV pilus assembly protein PilC
MADISTKGTNWLRGDIKLKFFQRQPSLKDIAVMSRQLATLIGAGLPALRAVKIVSEQSENELLAESLTRVAAGLEKGESMSIAMGKEPKIYPALMIGMVRAGETGGFVDRSLDSISSTLERDHHLRGTIKSAMSYPVAILILAFLAVTVMLIWIVPIFAGMFASLNSALPLPTQILVSLSPVAAWASPIIIVGGGFFANWYRQNKDLPTIRKYRDGIIARTPVFGKLVGKIAVARFARNLSNMVNSGVPILQAINVVAATAGNWPMEQALLRVEDAVRKGVPLAIPMKQEKMFPHMVTQMVSVGEDSGTLATMLMNIANFYDEEIATTTDQLTSLIEPIMVAFIGIVVGSMVVSLYLPIFDIYNHIK